LVEILQKDKE